MDITLVIPTYNRPDFLNRILIFYNSYNIKYKIIVADSSYLVNKKLNKRIVQLFPHLNILYLDHFPSKLIPHRKYAQMFEFVKTEYCVFCADDDFIVPEGIEKAYEFLEKNPDYQAAHGTYMSFYVSSGFGLKQFLWKFIYPYKSITSYKAQARLISHLTNYYQVLYAVRRTDIVKKCYRECTKSKVRSLAFGELLPDMLTLIYGKMKRLNIFYEARQAFSSIDYTWPSLKQDVKDGVYNKDYAKFKTYLISNLIRNTKLSKKKAEELIDTNMEIYLNSSTQVHIVGKIYFTLKKFPSFISFGLRFLHTRYLFLKDKKDRIGKIDDPNSPYFKDFNNIKKVALAIET